MTCNKYLMFILHTNLFLMVNLTLSFKLMLQPLAGRLEGRTENRREMSNILMEAWFRCLEKFQANRALRGDSGGVLLDLLKLVSQIAETNGGSSIDDHSQGNLLILPGCQKVHPLRQKLVLYAEAFLREQSILFSIPGANHHRNSIVMHTSENGFSSVLKGKQILFAQL